MYNKCVAARCYFYVPPPSRPDSQPHWGCTEEDEYMCKGLACIYAGTVPFVAEGGVHAEGSMWATVSSRSLSA